MLRRGARLGCRTFAGPCSLDVRGADQPALVTPGVADVGQYIGDLDIRQLLHRRHHGIEFLVVDHDRTRLAMQDGRDCANLVLEQIVRPGQRRKRARETLAIGLMAGEAGGLVGRFTGAVLRSRGLAGGCLSGMDEGR